MYFNIYLSNLYNIFLLALYSLGFFSRLTRGSNSSSIRKGLNKYLISLLFNNSTCLELLLNSLAIIQFKKSLFSLRLVLIKDSSFIIKERLYKLCLIL